MAAVDGAIYKKGNELKELARNQTDMAPWSVCSTSLEDRSEHQWSKGERIGFAHKSELDLDREEG